MQKKLTLASLNYDIHWLDSQEFEPQEKSPNSEKEFSAFLLSLKASQNFVVTSDHIYSLYKNFLHENFSGMTILQVRDGESSKSMATVEALCAQLLEAGADRHSVLWAFGGGVIGDITGFTASIYMRGIRFVQVPTTLLAMVDSSVGGKTGVNLSSAKNKHVISDNHAADMAKNIMGTFYQPQAVFIAIDFLKTLPKREMVCGLAEALKSALLLNPQVLKPQMLNSQMLNQQEGEDFFSYIENHVQEINERQADCLLVLSQESVRIKAHVVEQDEKENNMRAILNLGHTLAHALESFFEKENEVTEVNEKAGFNVINHGEAVSIGLHFAVFVSVKESGLPEIQAQRIIALLRKLQMPLFLQDVPNLVKNNMLQEKKTMVHKLVDLMRKDKKNKQGEIYFVLLSDIGKYLLPRSIAEKTLQKYLSEFLS